MKPTFYEVNTTVLGGLPIICQFNMYPAVPEDGVMSSYADDIKLLHYKTKKQQGKWVWERVMLNDKEFDKLLDKLYTHVACEDENFALEYWGNDEYNKW